MRSKAPHRRKNSTRRGWEGVVEKLSRRQAGQGSESATGAGHPQPVVARQPWKPRRLVRRSRIEETFEFQLKCAELTGYVTEHRFHPVRKWRFDFAWEDRAIAVEIEGGTWNGGRHTRGKGFEQDCEKYNEACAMGWKVFRFTSSMVTKGQAINLMKEVLNDNRDDDGSEQGS